MVSIVPIYVPYKYSNFPLDRSMRPYVDKETLGQQFLHY